MWEIFQGKVCKLASRFILVLIRHILKWDKSVLLWPPSVSTCCITVVNRVYNEGKYSNRHLQVSHLGIVGGLVAVLYAYQQCFANLQTDDSHFERLYVKGCPPPGRKSHPFLSYFQKARKHIHEKQMEVLEMAERESRNWFVFSKICVVDVCVSDCIQKISVSGQAFCSWCHKMIWYGTIDQHFVWLLFCVKVT